MSDWFLGVLLVVAAGAWWWTCRSNWRNRERLRTLIDELAAGRRPRSLSVAASGGWAPFTHSLQKLADLQDQLRQQGSGDEANLETILASMEEGVMVVDAEHILRRINPSFLKLHQLKSDPRGQTVLHTLRVPALEEIVTAALKSGEAQTCDVEMNGGKTTRHFVVHAVPMRDGNGHPGVVAIFRDMSRLRQLEDVRREFVANVSHELRTPLSIFRGYVENLLDDPSMPREEQAEVFSVLHKHSMRLNALLEDLLILARLESRYDELQREALAPTEFIRDLVGEWQERAARKQLVLSFEAPADLPAIQADPLRLSQVVNNLLENAVKYTDLGGRVAIRAACQDGWLTVRVEDSGSGIPPADLPHIFERFYRADKSRTRELGGTGLGLSIVKHIVQSHGGVVDAESTYGKGTTVSFRLPCGEWPASELPGGVAELRSA